MTGWLARIAERFQRTEVIARAIPAFKAARPLPLPHDYRNFADEGYRRNVIIYSCVRIIARSHASVPYVVEQQKGDAWDPVSDTHDLARLLENPNPEQDGVEWREESAVHYWVSGNKYEHKVRSNARRVVELWNLRPDRVRIQPDARGFVEGYRFPVDQLPIKAQTLPLEDVIHMKQPDPLDDYYGLSPIAVAAAVGDLDNNAVRYLRAFFENNGMPGLIFKSKIRIPKEQAAQIKQQFMDEYAGPLGWHTLAVVDAEGEFQDVGTRPDKLNLAAIFGETESRLCAAFGVPPIVVAAWIGLLRGTYSNYEQATRDLWNDTLCPYHSRFARKLTARLVPDFGPGLRIRADFSEVDALKEDRDARRKFALDGWNGGLLRRNQSLELAGLALEDGAVGEEYKSSGGNGNGSFGAFTRPAIAHPVKPPLIGPGQQQDIPDTQPDEPEWKALHRAADERADEMRRDFISAVNKTRKAINMSAFEKALNADDPAAAEAAIPWDSLGVDSMEEDYTKHLRVVFSKAQGSTRIPEKQSSAGPTEAQIKEMEIPPGLADEWAGLRVAELIREVGDETKAAVRSLIMRRFTGEVSTYRAVKQIRSLVGLTEKQEATVTNLISKLVDEGSSLDDAIVAGEKKTRGLLRFRAKMIARTEGIRAASAGQESVWQEAIKQGILPPEQIQFWIVTPDEVGEECPICGPMDGQERRIGDPFTKGTGGTIPAPPAHPQCRCARGLK